MPEAATGTAVVPAGDAAMSGRTKAAVMLLSLPEDKAVEVLRRLDPAEVEQLAVEVAALDYIPDDLVQHVVEEFTTQVERYHFVAGGGAGRIQDLLSKALPPERAERVCSRIQSEHQPPPFQTLAAAPITQAVEFLRHEHPQTIALVLAHLEQDRAAQILAELEEDQLKDVSLRLLQLEAASPDVIQALDEQIRMRMGPRDDDVKRDVGVDGFKRMVDILNSAPRGVETQVLEHLMEANEDLYQQVRRAMFVFDDLIALDGRSVQRLLREVESSDLTLALKGAKDELLKLFFSNMSERAAVILKEDMQFMGPARVSDVHEAQQRIINAARNLEAAGEIVIPRGNSDAMIE